MFSNGSASFITDATGYAEQHTMCRSIFYGALQANLCSTNTNKIQIGIQYLPFGELFVSQRNGSFDSRYMFTAKELITYHLERKMYNLVLCNFVNVPIKPHIIYALLAKILKER